MKEKKRQNVRRETEGKNQRQKERTRDRQRDCDTLDRAEKGKLL